MTRKNYSLDNETIELVDDWAEEYRNNNSSRMIEDLVKICNEAVNSTDKDDPRDAVRSLAQRTAIYSGSIAEYDPEEDYILAYDTVKNMTDKDPVPEINPDHVDIDDVLQLQAWHKAGLIVGFCQYNNVETEKELKKNYRRYKSKYAGKRSALSWEIVKDRWDDRPEFDKWQTDSKFTEQQVKELVRAEYEKVINDDYEKLDQVTVNNRIEYARELIHVKNADGLPVDDEFKHQVRSLDEYIADLNLY